MLKGKQGRFRQNLLENVQITQVDGVVVGPDHKIT